MLLVEVAALQEHCAGTCTGHGEMMLLSNASVDPGGALPLHSQAIARLWLLWVDLDVASSTFIGAIASSASIVAFNSVALRELVELKEATVVV